jgi:hypothetical protein
VLGAVHERIPIVTLAEQQALQLENANADLRFWNGLAGMHAETIEGHKALTAAAERKIADREAQRAKVSEKAAQARNRVARIERGEDVQGGLGQPVTYDRRSNRRRTRVLDHVGSRNEGPKEGREGGFAKASSGCCATRAGLRAICDMQNC